MPEYSDLGKMIIFKREEQFLLDCRGTRMTVEQVFVNHTRKLVVCYGPHLFFNNPYTVVALALERGIPQPYWADYVIDDTARQAIRDAASDLRKLTKQSERQPAHS